MRRFAFLLLTLFLTFATKTARAQDLLIPEVGPESRDDLLRRITQHTPVNGLAIAPDGVFAAAGELLRLWDGINGETVAAMSGLYPGPFVAAALSPDGSTVVGLSLQGEMNAWTIGPPKFKVSFVDRDEALRYGRDKAHFGSRANAIAYSPDGKFVVSGAADAPPIKIWNAEDGRVVRALQPQGVSEVVALAFSPDGSHLILGSDKNLIVVKTADWSIERTLPAHDGIVRSIAFDADGKTLATASDDGTARLWSTETFEVKQTLKGHTAAVRSVAFSSDGDLVATASLDRTVRIWTNTGESRATVKHPRPVYTAAFTESGSELITGSADNTVRLFRTDDWKMTQRMTADTENDAAFLYDRNTPFRETAPDPALTPMAVPPARQTTPKILSGPSVRELPALATVITALINSDDAAQFEALLTEDGLSIDGAPFQGGRQASLVDREGLRARLFDSNRFRSLILGYLAARQERPEQINLERFRSLRDILKSDPAAIGVQILDRARRAGEDDAATIVFHWNSDPSLYGFREYAQFAVARTSSGWRIIDVTMPLDLATTISRYRIRRQSLQQIHALVDRLIRSSGFAADDLKRITRERQESLAFVVQFAAGTSAWNPASLNSAEVVFRWDGDPSDFGLDAYPKLSLFFENGNWKVR